MASTGLTTDESFQRQVNNILQLIRRFRRGRALVFRSFLRLLSMFTAASSVVPLCLLSLKTLQIWMNNLGLHPTRHRCKRVKVTASCLRYHGGEKHISLRGFPKGPYLQTRVVATHASLAGWGAAWQSWTARGQWSPWQREQHLNVYGATGCSAPSAGRQKCPQ